MTKEIKYNGECELSKLYKGLPDNLTTFLRKKESNMREIVGKAYTDLGRELKEAQDALAKNGYGCFEKWFTSLGFKKRNVYRLIDRFNLVRANLAQSDLLEDLPVSLTYDIAKPSAESTPAKAQAKAEVLAGEIASRKAYKERIKELEEKARQAEQSAELERKERERLERENDELVEKADKPPEVRTEYIVPNDYDEVKRENAELRNKYGNNESRVIDDGSREEFYREFANDLSYIIAKYGSIVFDGDKIKEYGGKDVDYANKVNEFDEFWKRYVKTVLNDQIIINMEAK